MLNIGTVSRRTVQGKNRLARKNQHRTSEPDPYQINQDSILSTCVRYIHENQEQNKPFCRVAARRLPGKEACPRMLNELLSWLRLSATKPFM